MKNGVFTEHRDKNKYRILYHIAKDKPFPKPFRKDVDGAWFQEKRYLKYPNEPVVFMTPSYVEVAYNHGILGNVYAFKVPMGVIRAAGGVRRYDRASEIIIPEHLWGEVEFIGKVLSRDELLDIAMKSSKENHSYKKQDEELTFNNSRIDRMYNELIEYINSGVPYNNLELTTINKFIKPALVNSIREAISKSYDKIDYDNIKSIIKSGGYDKIDALLMDRKKQENKVAYEMKNKYKLYEEVYGSVDHHGEAAHSYPVSETYEVTPVEPECAEPREYYMASKALKVLAEYSQVVLSMMESGKELPEWAEAKIIEASAYLRDVKHCLEHGDDE